MLINFLVQLTILTSTSTAASDFWRDSIWQPIGVFIATILALISIILTFKQLQKKSLTYTILDESNILTIPNIYKQDLEIKYKQNTINSLYVVTITFKNSGNVAIKPDDFKNKISISGGEQKFILSADILTQKPNDLNVTIELIKDKAGDFVYINPVLLNKNDYFKIRLLFENFNRIDVKGRIVDVEEIKKLDPTKDNSSKMLLIVTFLFSFIVFLIGSVTIIDKFYKSIDSHLAPKRINPQKVNKEFPRNKIPNV